jgi:hypothetical protein
MGFKYLFKFFSAGPKPLSSSCKKDFIGALMYLSLLKTRQEGVAMFAPTIFNL